MGFGKDSFRNWVKESAEIYAEEDKETLED